MFRVDVVPQGFVNLPFGGLLFATVLHRAISVLLRGSLAGISADKLDVLLSCKVSLDFASGGKDVCIL